MNGPSYAHFMAVNSHTATAALGNLEKDADLVGAAPLLSPAAGVKGWLGRSLSRLSNNSYTPGGRDSVGGSSSCQVSECGYQSDGGDSQQHQVTSQNKRTTSGRPSTVTWNLEPEKQAGDMQSVG